jgi:Tfp pilus assembly protein PilF
MKPSRFFLYAGLLIFGAVIGFWASSYLHQRGAEAAAMAGLMAAGECLRKDDAVCAMTYAQSALNNAPYAYDGYEAVGDVYAKLNVPSAASKMYERAIERLGSDGEGAMLVTKGMTSVEGAAKLVQRKLDALPPADTPNPDAP